MPYRYARSDESYEVYAPGGVIVAAPGYTAFPVRLADEIFRRCMAVWDAGREARRCTLYDPFCGSAYLLTTLAYLNWDRIERLIGSDTDADALGLAARNLSLLTPDGLDRRIGELADMAERFGKASHAQALGHAALLRERLAGHTRAHPIATHLFRADATDRDAVRAGLDGILVDVVITDIPYGQRAQWSADTRALASGREPTHELLDALLPALADGAVVAVVSPKRVPIRHEGYQQVGKFKLGKRQAVFLRPASP